jgi:hypothetical protein
VSYAQLARRPQRLDAPHQMKAVAASLAAVAGLVDERADDVDAEPTDGPIFWRLRQIRLVESERIEERPIVDEAYPQTAPAPSQRHGDTADGRMETGPMRYRVGEELFEDDQEPPPLVIRQSAFMRELVRNGLKPGELCMLGT